MLHFFDSLRDITLFSVLVRMLLAVVCGAAIGLERSYKKRPAGFRTPILVCIGATAAGLWACGIIGLALGTGFFEGGILAAATLLMIEINGSDLGSRIRHLPEFHISLRYQDKAVLDNMLSAGETEEP